jgi:hypothetical protein
MYILKRVLVVHYSQTGQLTKVVNAFIEPLLDHPEIEVIQKTIAPQTPYPFPWPFLEFFSIFPESVLMQPPPMKPLDIDTDFDLIILAYQVWFLSPSLPTTGFLRSNEAQKVFNGKPVITLIACRDMWLTAQEKIKKELQRLDAHLIDNIVLVDEGGSATSFMSTPLWMFSGHQGPWRFVPKAGIAKADIHACNRFGKRLAEELISGKAKLDTLFKGLGAVTIKEKTIASELIAHRSFLVWSKILQAAGSQNSTGRRLMIRVYVVFLVTLILTVVPISALIKKLLSPLTQKRITKQKAYYALPSGESRHAIIDEQSVN